jgi:hypothetical protein
MKYDLSMVAVVTTEADLKTNIVDDATISIGADILLTSIVNVNNVTGLLIEGNSFKIDGQEKGNCFYITSGSIVILRNMTITNGYAVIKTSFESIMYYI